ncbi:uncharacterized protein B0I36DRAFT_102353 [Microdochium trichocladiopsis]|uniref:Uncharacterized protein n=1 Tax=Microdochium trichocladiopsis TaxID=1682393 RepID=A0A9P8YB24_9PEZI|nr:uncharacterized protein B0I36DRAFT_102353 [Microdochium trichocladiopsis]KAH7032917.1 hypothetical protein B0I36DRAFT_102353 [Microdochium trichocladiopsis]
MLRQRRMLWEIRSALVVAMLKRVLVVGDLPLSSILSQMTPCSVSPPSRVDRVRIGSKRSPDHSGTSRTWSRRGSSPRLTPMRNRNFRHAFFVMREGHEAILSWTGRVMDHSQIDFV